MAVTQGAIYRQLSPIVDEVAVVVGRLGIKRGEAEGAKAVLRIEPEDNVRRIIQAYWTPFEANIMGPSIGLHLEVAEPRVHWAETYLSPIVPSWYFAFAERGDENIELVHYAQYDNTRRALDMFVKLSGWYVLSATELAWEDVVYQVSPELQWTDHHEALAGPFTGGAIQESLKKSTIIWLRWRTADGVERTMPVWYVMDQGKIYVLSGERQQNLPGAAEMTECDVTLRWKGKNARVAEMPAFVQVMPLGPEWDAIAEKIAEKRLNIPGMPEETARRWRSECVILELTLQT